jgi:hypothetical protein
VKRPLTAVFPGDEHDECDFHIRPFKDFSMGLATNRLANLSISSQASRQADEELSASSGYTGTGSGTARGTEQPDVALNMTEEERAKQALLKLGCFTNLDAYIAVGLEDCGATTTRTSSEPSYFRSVRVAHYWRICNGNEHSVRLRRAS